MTHESGIELRVSRLENDREHLFDLIERLRATFNAFRREVRGDIRELKGDVVVLKTDVSVLKTEFTEFRTETAGRFDRIELTLAEVVRRLPEPS